MINDSRDGMGLASYLHFFEALDASQLVTSRNESH